MCGRLVLLMCFFDVGLCILPNYAPKNCTKMEMFTTTMSTAEEYICYKTEKLCTSFDWYFKLWTKCFTAVIPRQCINYKTVEVTKYKTILTCCPGYMDTGNTTHCTKGCSIGKYGMACDQDCNCPYNAFKECNMYTGECTCKEGWMGEGCTEECSPGYFGRDCSMKCICENNSTCNAVIGECDCTNPGWTGTYCEQSCPSQTYGVNCMEACSCGPNTTCNPINGLCECNVGLRGTNCDEECTNFTYGAGCQNPCPCIVNNTELCSPINGQCSCKAGFTGDICEQVCSNGKYGKNCQEICSCSSEDICDPFHGQCVSKCQCNRQGTQNCENQTCSCPSNIDINAEHLHQETIDVTHDSNCCIPYPLSSLCQCHDGWFGNRCETTCNFGTFGPGCNQRCNCSGTASCHHITGQCPLPLTAADGLTNHNENDNRLLLVVLIVAIVICVLLAFGIIILLYCYRTGKMEGCCNKEFRKDFRTKFQETKTQIKKRLRGGTYQEPHFSSFKDNNDSQVYNVMDRAHRPQPSTSQGGSLYDHAAPTQGGSLYHHANQKGEQKQGLDHADSMYSHAIVRGAADDTHDRSLYSHVTRADVNHSNIQVDDTYSHSTSQ